MAGEAVVFNGVSGVYNTCVVEEDYVRVFSADKLGNKMPVGVVSAAVKLYDLYEI